MRFLLVFISILLTQLAWSQEPIAIPLTEKDGLPDIEFYDIIEDAKGFIWLAADKGLYRYNGKNFTYFAHPEQRGLSVFELFEDEQNRIWFVNISGQFFYVDNNKVHLFKDLGKELHGKLPSYRFIENALFVFSLKDIIKVHLDTKEVKTVESKDIIGKPLLSKSVLFVTIDKTVYSYIEGGELKKEIDLSPIYNTAALKNNALEGYPVLVKLPENILLYQSRAVGTGIYNIKNYEVKEVPGLDKIKNLSVSQVQVIGDELWICTNKGVHVYDFQFIFKRSFLEDRYTTKVIIDKDKNYWISTLRSGVFVVPNIHILNFPKLDKTYNISCTETLTGGDIAFGTTDGLFGVYTIADGTYRMKNLASDAKVSAIQYNASKDIVYVSQDDIAQIMDIKSWTSTESYGFINAKDIALFNENAIFFTSYFGAVILEDAHLPTQDEDKDILSNKRGYTCYKDEFKDAYYVAYVDDLTIYDKDLQPSAVRFNNTSIFATNMTNTSDGTLWASTFKNGIFKIEDAVATANITTRDGLLSNSIIAIKGDGESLWIVNEEGVQLYNTITKEIKTLSDQDGIPSYKVSGIELVGDLVIFGTNKGFFSIEKENAFKKTNTPQIEITSVKIVEKDSEIKNNYRLPYDKNRLEIQLNANTFKSAENIYYEYRLLGGIKTWSRLQKGVDKIVFNSLSSGNYTLEAKAINKSNGKTSAVKKIEITILKPFWKTWWFTITIIVLIVIAFLIFIRKRQQRILLKKEAELSYVQTENEINALKLENLRSQMNPHFIFNALNSIQEYIILNKGEQASDYLGKFSDLIRGYLSNSLAETINLREELKGLETYLELEKMRFEEDFTAHIHFCQEALTENYEIPTMLIQPYIENAIKHGLLHKQGMQLLSVNATLLKDGDLPLLKVLIEDNGIGREKAATLSKKYRKKHTSFSTQATENRLQLLNHKKHIKVGVTFQDLYNEDATPRGTRVVLIIPLEK